MPRIEVSLSYTSSHMSVLLGNIIPVPATLSRPVFQLTPFNNPSLTPTRTSVSNKTFTLVLSDPDATSRAEPVKSQM